MKYYAIYNTETGYLSKGCAKCLNSNFENLEITKEIYDEFEKYIYSDSLIILDPDYEVKQQAKEQSRIQQLSMTKSDFFDGMIRAFGLDQDDLQPAIELILTQLSISDIDKKVAMNNYKNAKDFYRKHTLFTLLSDREIPISETQSIKISSTQWDKFFDETNKGNEEAYKELIGE